MGILEEAIREHLDLKRSRGADPAEVERQASEALSPAVREPQPAQAAEPAAPDEHSEAKEPPEFHEPPAHESLGEMHPEDDPFAHPAEPPHADPASHLAPPPHAEPKPVRDPESPPPDVSQPTEAIDTDAMFAEEDATRVMPSAEPPPRTLEPPAPALRQPVEDDYTDEIFAEPKPPEPDHDELEDTPEFLQETPEHDRLWFEQKPPKDFDFDD